jgi:hypothetical protein
MAKKPTEFRPAEEAYGSLLSRVTASVAKFYGNGFEAASRLALPYWLLKNVDHIAFLAAVSSVFLIVKSVDAFLDPERLKTLPIVVAVVLFSFLVGWALYVFVPTPVRTADDTATSKQNQRNIACTFLLLCCLSVVVHEVLTGFGILSLTNPDEPPFGIEPIESDFIRNAMAYISSVIASVIGVVLLFFKQRVFDRKREPDLWDGASSLRSIGPLAFAYIIPTTLAVFYLTI